MTQDVCVISTTGNRARLTTIAGDWSRLLKHVQRARIILHSADHLPVLAAARRAGVKRGSLSGFRSGGDP